MNFNFIDYSGDELGTPTFAEFKRRVKHNLSVITPSTFNFVNYEFFDLVNKRPKNIHTDILSKSINDIRGAIPLGQLALYAAHGADAIMLKDGKFIETELKTIEVDETRIVIGQSGEIYYRTGNNLSKIETALKIMFVVTNEYIIKSKNRPTFVILRSRQSGTIIDAWYLDGDIIEREIRKGDPTVAGKSVSLKTFILEGRHEQVVVEHTGWEAWQKNMKASAIHELRRRLTEDIIAEYAEKRSIVRTYIRNLRIVEKKLMSKISQGNRLSIRSASASKKEKVSIDIYSARIAQIDNRLKNDEIKEKLLISELNNLSDDVKSKARKSEIKQDLYKIKIYKISSKETKNNQIIKTVKRLRIVKNLEHRSACILTITKRHSDSMQKLTYDLQEAQLKIDTYYVDEQSELDKSKKLRELLIRNQK